MKARNKTAVLSQEKPAITGFFTRES